MFEIGEIPLADKALDQRDEPRVAEVRCKLASELNDLNRGPDDPTVKQVAEILKRAADEIEQAWQASTGSSSTTR